MASTMQDPDTGGSVPQHPLTITIAPEPGSIVLLLEGEVDLASVPTLSACLDHVAAESVERVVVDFTSVTFCDSSGINALVHGYTLLADAGRQLRVRNLCPILERALTVTGLLDVLTDAPTDDERVAG